MSLFQRMPQAGEATQYYTVGQNKTILLVGLGNPGAKYDGTRHNIGFACLDAFVEKTDGFDGWIAKKDLKCELAQGRLGENRVIAIKPTTYMNLSGEAVQAVAQFYKIPTDSMLVLHDELDINWGLIRTRTGGSAAGHNGLKSLIQHCGEGFGRIRIGIGPKQPAEIDSADFVLQKFTQDEQAEVSNLNREVIALINEYIFGGELPNDTRSFLI